MEKGAYTKGLRGDPYHDGKFGMPHHHHNTTSTIKTPVEPKDNTLKLINKLKHEYQVKEGGVEVPLDSNIELKSSNKNAGLRATDTVTIAPLMKKKNDTNGINPPILVKSIKRIKKVETKLEVGDMTESVSESQIADPSHKKSKCLEEEAQVHGVGDDHIGSGSSLLGLVSYGSSDED
jgi:hypothetical protein